MKGFRVWSLHDRQINDIARFAHQASIVTYYVHVFQGYVALSILLIEHSDLLRLCIQSVRNDLNGVNEVFQCLALTAIANVGEQEMAEALAGDVQKLLLTTCVFFVFFFGGCGSGPGALTCSYL